MAAHTEKTRYSTTMSSVVETMESRRKLRPFGKLMSSVDFDFLPTPAPTAPETM